MADKLLKLTFHLEKYSSKKEGSNTSSAKNVLVSPLCSTWIFGLPPSSTTWKWKWIFALSRLKSFLFNTRGLFNLEDNWFTLKDQCFMSPWTVPSLNFRPMSRFASNQHKRVWRPITGAEKKWPFLYGSYIYVTSKITIFRLRLSRSLLEKRLTENCIWGIESDLVLRRVANESFRVSEGDITRSCSISLIISDYFNLSMLENTNTRIGSSKIDSYGWSRHFSAEKIKFLWRHNSCRKMKIAWANRVRYL